MIDNKRFAGLFVEAEAQNSYWTEKAILDFSIELYRLLHKRGLSKKEFATKINKSQAYVTKVFRGDANFTIETMVTLVRALDGELNLHVTAKEENVVNWLKVIRGGKKETAVNHSWGRSVTAETLVGAKVPGGVSHEFAVVA